MAAAVMVPAMVLVAARTVTASLVTGSPAAATPLVVASNAPTSRVPAVAAELSRVPVRANSAQPTSRNSSTPMPPRVRAVAKAVLRAVAVLFASDR
jgi:hypothetical protein